MFYNFTQFANVINGVLDRKELNMDIIVDRYRINISTTNIVDRYVITIYNVITTSKLCLNYNKNNQLVCPDVVMLSGFFNVKIGKQYYRLKSITNIIYFIYYYAKKNNILPSDVKAYISSSYYTEKYEGQ